MKRKIKSVLLSMSLVVLIGSSGDQAFGQNRLIPVADTGVITLGSNQILRVTVATGDVTGDDTAVVRFRQLKYNRCQASPKLCVVQQSISDPIVLAATESEDGDSDGADFLAWRTIVMSSRRDVKVTAIVFDTATLRVVTQIIVANTEGDIH